MNSPKRWAALLLAVLLSPTVFGQDNLPAVDSLKKEVAKAVFAGIKGQQGDGEKAEQIRQELKTCGSGCEPGALIRRIGGWDRVADKLTFFDQLRQNATFTGATGTALPAQLRKSLSDFYGRYKKELIYKRALGEDDQIAIATTVFQQVTGGSMPTPAAESPSVEPEDTLSDSTDNVTAADTGTPVQSTETPKQVPMWLFIAGTLGGLLLGGAAVFLMVSRRAKETVFAMQQEMENLKRRAEKPTPVTKPTNTPTNEVIILPKNVQNQLDLLNKIREEVGSVTDPLGAIRQLKGPVAVAAPVAVEAATMDTAPVAAAPVPVTEPLKMEVFYYPAPNEQGLFDDAQRSAVPTPDSAYKLIIHPQRPEQAAFRFEPEPGRMKRFLTYRTYFIDPACDSENNYAEDAHTRIVTRTDGSAVKEAGNWRVQTKAVIRFE
ncbi:hypothetical protein [Tellurirhabdus rosea]|uniref:hypothetical protein n=1 Tax=Tellurirhabdus rosea TaxID=2674997 RepID=UPI00224DAA70|nr:hypothetical protein [Tellurirhabdus rosea]